MAPKSAAAPDLNVVPDVDSGSSFTTGGSRFVTCNIQRITYYLLILKTRQLKHINHN